MKSCHYKTELAKELLHVDQPDKTKKRRTAEMENKSCVKCENCIYIGEGDFLCDQILEIVLEDWCVPTGFHCENNAKRKRRSIENHNPNKVV